MKRIKTKLLVIFLIIAAGFAYQYTITINDTDIQKMAQQLVEQKLSSSSSQQTIFFKDVAVVKRNQYKDGEGVRVCGLYQVGEAGSVLPFVASVDVRDGKFSGHNQLLLSDTPEIQASVTKICQEEKS